MFDAGKQTEGITAESSGEAEEPDAGHKRPAGLRHSLQRTLKLYVSASRLALGQSAGQNRWLTAAGVAGALSFALLGTGLAALVAPYAGVQTAALTADDAPQIIALDADGTGAGSLSAMAGLRSTTGEALARTAESEEAPASPADIAALEAAEAAQ